jgi:hypothetical protein
MTDSSEEKETFNPELSRYAVYFVKHGYYDTSFVHFVHVLDVYILCFLMYDQSIVHFKCQLYNVFLRVFQQSIVCCSFHYDYTFCIYTFQKIWSETSFTPNLSLRWERCNEIYNIIISRFNFGFIFRNYKFYHL